MKAVDYAIELAKKEDNSRITLLNILDIDTAKQVSSSIITAPTYGLEEYELHKKSSRLGYGLDSPVVSVH